MSKVAERKYIEKRMRTLFKAAHPAVKIGFENSNFKEPEDEIYGTFSILGGKGVPVAGSGGRTLITRTPGIVQVIFWVPNETGMILADEYGETFKRIFQLHRGRTTSGDVVTFKVPEYPKSGLINGWQPVIIKIPFYRDESVNIPTIE